VALNRKAEAPPGITAALDNWILEASEKLARINAVARGWRARICRQSCPASRMGLCSPKVETAEQLRWARRRLKGGTGAGWPLAFDRTAAGWNTPKAI